MASCCRIILRPKKELFINGDRERISQVLINLISNAVKYSPRGGDIIINWKKTPEGIVVSVKDEGIGISKEMQAKVFERFFRVNDVKSNTFPGMGPDSSLLLTLYSATAEKSGWKASRGKALYFILPYLIKSIVKKSPYEAISYHCRRRPGNPGRFSVDI